MPTEEKIFEIECKWSIYYTIKVPATSFDRALNKLCNKELLTGYGGLFEDPTFGLDEEELARIGAEVTRTQPDGDPSPTGRPWVQGEWIYHVEESEGGEE